MTIIDLRWNMYLTDAALYKHMNYSDIINYDAACAQTGESRRVTHLQFTSWPDYGVPHSADAFLRFMMLVREKQAEGVADMEEGWLGHPHGPPIVVHCSAGIGRTGTSSVLRPHRPPCPLSSPSSVFTILRPHRSPSSPSSPYSILQPPSSSSSFLAILIILRPHLVLPHHLVLVPTILTIIRPPSSPRLPSSLITSSSPHPLRPLRPLSSLRPPSSPRPHPPRPLLRPGTFITMDISTRRLADVGCVDLRATVLAIRAQRAFSIQMPEQYVFCYLALIEHAQQQGLLPLDLLLDSFDECSDSDWAGGATWRRRTRNAPRPLAGVPTPRDRRAQTTTWGDSPRDFTMPVAPPDDRSEKSCRWKISRASDRRSDRTMISRRFIISRSRRIALVQNESLCDGWLPGCK